MIEVARVGKSVGLKGDLKLHIISDFPEQFKTGSVYHTKLEDVEIVNYDGVKNLVRFKDYEDREKSKKLINQILYSTAQESKDNCSLKEGEFFAFDIIGCNIEDESGYLGIVKETDRFAQMDYLLVETDKELSKKERLPKDFYIPYVDRYVVNCDIENKKIITKDAKDILENS